jgi:hypothetical protein
LFPIEEEPDDLAENDPFCFEALFYLSFDFPSGYGTEG